MIKYALVCRRGHEFDGWFSSIADYDSQADAGLLSCPLCGTQKVAKAIMAPAVSTSRAQERQALSMMNQQAAKIREAIARDCDDVGDKFANEARAIHYGEKEARAIYGRASADEARALIDEGIGIAPLPEALVPTPKAKLN